MSLSARITETGIIAPSYEDILAEIQAQIRSIYGSDIYIDPDSQDGQMIAIWATAINDANNMAIAVYNSFSPATAQGAGLSSVVKINGIAREVATNSTADILCVGQPGRQIGGGIVGDNLGLNTQWQLPASVIIPPEGQITATATCTEEGDIKADANTLTIILTPTAGWQSANNPDAATEGAPVESDATLRQRQSVSTALPAKGPLDSILAGVANLSGVGRYAGYENDQDDPDANDIPGHSISIVVSGGDAQDIANTIAIKKAPGTGTYGTTTEIVYDSQGMPNEINFFRLTNERIIVTINLHNLTGYVDTTGDLIKQAVADFINALPIDGDVFYKKLYGPANLVGNPLTDTFNITSILIAKFGDAPAEADIAILFNQAATCAVADITLNVA